MERVKYVKITNTQYASEGNILTVMKGEVRLFFDMADKSFKILSALGNEVIVSGRLTADKSLRHKLMMRLKKELKKLGSAYHVGNRKKRLPEEVRELKKLGVDKREIHRLIKKTPEEWLAELEEVKSQLREERRFNKLDKKDPVPWE